MADIRTVWNADTQSGDWRVVDGGLDASSDLETAVLLSLFTWARASEDDELPVKGGDRKGWWGNHEGEALHGLKELGSKLWLLSRRLATEETRQDAIRHAADALKWMTARGVAARVEVDAEWISLGGRSGAKAGFLGLVVKIYDRDGAVVFDRRYAWAWDQLASARA